MSRLLTIIIIIYFNQVFAVDVSNPRNHAYHEFKNDFLIGDYEEFGTYTVYTPDIPLINNGFLVDELYLKVRV